MTRSRRSTPPRGTTLVEMMTVIAILSAMLALSAVALAAGLRVGRASEERRSQAAAWHRLGRLLRADAHQARSLVGEPAAGPASTLELVAGDGARVVYTIDPRRIERREWPAARPSPEVRPRRESFPLWTDGKTGRAEFRLEPGLLVLAIVGSGTSASAPTADDRATAPSWLVGEQLVAALPPGLVVTPASEPGTLPTEDQP